MNYLFIGHGRIARHLGHHLNSEGHSVCVWSRRSTQDLAPLINNAQVICISTRDHEIRGVLAAYGLLDLGKPVIHFSGSQHIEGALGFHPLMSFGTELYSPDVYRKMHFVGVPSSELFQKHFPKLKNTYHKIEARKLALYHAYCSMAGNFPQLLWAEISEQFEAEVDVSPGALGPYLEQITANFISHGKAAVTGPLVRNDNRTLVRHLDALSGRPLQNIYYSFLNLFQKKKRRPHELRGISTDQI